MKKVIVTETELITIIKTMVNEQEEGTSDAGGTGAKTWETGLTRGPANPAGGGVSHWADSYSIGRGKGNPLWEDSEEDGPVQIKQEKDRPRVRPKKNPEPFDFTVDDDGFTIADRDIRSYYNEPSFDEMKRKHSIEYDAEFGTGPLNESKWYNTFLDFVGIVDPTGIADGINAMSYFKQGDVLYGMLSLISLIPYVGDAVAKPFIALMKTGKINTKVINAGLKSGNPTKVAAEMGKTKAGKAVLEAMKNSTTLRFLGKIISKIGKLPGFRSFAKDAQTYVKVFSQAAKQTGKVKIFRKGGGVLTRMQRKGLLNRTKLYAKFISYLTGTGVGAAAIEGMGEGKLNGKFNEFLKSNEGVEFFNTLNKGDQGDFVDALK